MAGYHNGRRIFSAAPYSENTSESVLHDVIRIFRKLRFIKERT